jgi:hypothetical protein
MRLWKYIRASLSDYFMLDNQTDLSERSELSV